MKHVPYNQAVVEVKTLIYEMRRFVKEYENEYFTYRPSVPTYRLIGSQKSTAKFDKQVCAEEK